VDDLVRTRARNVNAHPGLVIGGAVANSIEGEVFVDIEPATGKPLAIVQAATGADVDVAVEGAVDAQAAWASSSVFERASRMRMFAAEVRTNLEDLAYLDAIDSGNPIRGMRADVEKGAAAIEYFAGLAPELQGRTIPASVSHLHYSVRKPIGIVGVITAYNHPALYALARTAAPLAAGNAVLLKPAEQTPLSALRIGEIAAKHFPPGLLNVLSGGALAGDALVRHPRVRRIAFTGSVETALTIQSTAAAAGSIKRLAFELGGKNPLIVMPDADLEKAVAGAVEGMNLERVLGQSCGSTSRAFVHDSMYDAFVEDVAGRFTALRHGPPEDDATELGPLVSAEQWSKVDRYVRRARDAGAKLITGGAKPTDSATEGGFFYLPTLFSEASPGDEIAREEIFGPVLTVLRWSDESAMLAAVNDTRYGLTAAIYTEGIGTALRLARSVEAGYVWINDVERRWLGVPFGGHKDSGTAVEYSLEEVYENSLLQSVSVRL
jgi:betaine-aldehyde dehydrogenase